MKSFQLKQLSKIHQSEIFRISTDIENFHNILPSYFKSLKILNTFGNTKIVSEKISFYGFLINVKTKHVVHYPYLHIVHMISGPLSGTSFEEFYHESKSGTMIVIRVTLKFSGLFRIFSFLSPLVARKMSKIMNDFVLSAENYAHSKSETNSI